MYIFCLKSLFRYHQLKMETLFSRNQVWGLSTPIFENKENSYLESLHLFLLFFHGGFVTIVFQGSLKVYISFLLKPNNSGIAMGPMLTTTTMTTTMKQQRQEQRQEQRQ